MNFKVDYWTKVFKRLAVCIFTCIGIILCFKLAIFYIPFLIAFIISLLIEPAIRFINNKTNFSRKTCAIIMLVIASVIIILLLSFGIISVISESSNVLQGLNENIDMIYGKIQEIIEGIDKIELPVRI